MVRKAELKKAREDLSFERQLHQQQLHANKIISDLQAHDLGVQQAVLHRQMQDKHAAEMKAAALIIKQRESDATKAYNLLKQEKETANRLLQLKQETTKLQQQEEISRIQLLLQQEKRKRIRKQTNKTTASNHQSRKVSIQSTTQAQKS